MSVNIDKSIFGVTRDGHEVHRYRLTNSGDTAVEVITFGGIISSWMCADLNGQVENIVLGYDTLAEYEDCEIYMGCITGRFANRIAHGRFTLDDVPYQLEQNDSAHHLHGGLHGFNKVIWQARIDDTTAAPTLVLSHLSPDGAGGYPGNLDVSIRLSLSEDNTLSLKYSASTDKPTVVNLTSHSYFNLRGDRFAIENGVLDHELQLPASGVLEVDEEAIPTGKIIPVADSAFDFADIRTVGGQIQERSDLYDHCYVLDGTPVAAMLRDPLSGRALEVSTTLPGMQLYTAQFVRDCKGRDSVVYGRRGALCLETQLFPDAPNHPDFPTSVVRPDAAWAHETTYSLTHL